MSAFEHVADGDRADILHQHEAVSRRATIHGIPEYSVSLVITGGIETFSGTVALSFVYRSGSTPLFLDLFAQRVDSLVINGVAVQPSTEGPSPFRGHRVYLDTALLRNGCKNNVVIQYTAAFSTSGNGLHRFVDPLDSQEYLYAQCEPFAAHQYFPCFDQPDIKAIFSVTVKAPEAWEVIANYPVKTRNNDAGYGTWVFEESAVMSTYLLCIVAGQYDSFTDIYDGRVPLSFHCRKSLSSVVKEQVSELFTITKQGFAFYEEFFNCKYPFSKYAQAFVCEFNMGAMENIGIVTYNESYAFRDRVTDRERARRADTILHEMAHMWFGDLVTMEWWNGLWLNESFATYMAALCVYEATEFKSSWQVFESDMKAWAYNTDQLSTTHNIEAPIPDTDATFLNFDGITYGKGASVLKQLVARVGMSHFKTGMQRYFKKYAYCNTTLPQFLECVSADANIDIGAWSKIWLETPGLNTLRTHYVENGGIIQELSIHQTAPDAHPTLRSHLTQVALYNLDDNGVPTTSSVVEVLVEGAKTVVDVLIGTKAPECIFPNNGDHAYAKFILDDASLAFVKKHLPKFPDALTRQVLWRTLWNMTRDAAGLTSLEYLELVLVHAGSESEITILADVIANAREALSTYMPSESLRLSFGQRLFQFAYESLQSQRGDLQVQMIRAAIRFALTSDNVQLLIDLIDSSSNDVVLDQGQRWLVLQAAVAMGIQGALERIEAEKIRDASDRGVREAETARTSVPTAEAKAAAWAEFTTQEPKSLYLYDAAVDGFMWRCQRNLVAPYVQPFFELVPKMFEKHVDEREYAMKFFQGLFPLSPEDPNDLSIIQATEQLLEATPASSQVQHHSITEALDELRRAHTVQMYALARHK